MPKLAKSVQEPAWLVSGDAGRYDHREGNDDYSQPRALFRLFASDQEKRLFSNIADAMKGVPQFIIERQLGHFDRVDLEYRNGVRGPWRQPCSLLRSRLPETDGASFRPGS